jgi:hypothetical protein
MPKYSMQRLRAQTAVAMSFVSVTQAFNIDIPVFSVAKHELKFQKRHLLVAYFAYTEQMPRSSAKYYRSLRLEGERGRNRNTRLIHKVSFPEAVYRNKTQLHGNIYCNR